MIWFLLGAHAVAAAIIPAALRRFGPRALAGAAVVPLATATWAIVANTQRSDTPTAELTWVEGLDLTFAFRIDDLAALLTLVVSGIGAVVFVYAAGYFSPGSAGLGRFGATIIAFSGSMVGLVWADSVWTLFVFWELTSVTSFLLVGHKTADAGAQRAARRALMITAVGGLALLAGFLLLVDSAGTDRLSELEPATGSRAVAAAVLVIAAAATKSAQVPFHVWLPGAMAAPTPVSAYLHSAAMVKAGIVLLAVASPALSETSVWTPMGLAVGGASMLWGAIGALRQLDAKLVLAWGTVSQLGLLVVLLSLGTGKATFAAVALLVTHAVFKAALFMVIGEIDVRTGTRDIRELGGLARTMPVTSFVLVAAGASMAGIPPLLGFPAKEAAIEAALGVDGTTGAIALAVVALGSVLTVAYTLRLVVALLGGEPPEALTVAPRRRAMEAPAVILALAGFVGFVVLGTVTTGVRAAASEIDPGASVYSLLRWPGPTTALGISAAVVAVGTVVGVMTSAVRDPAPRPLGAELVDRTLDSTVVVARRITGRLQHGSLPAYLATMAAVAALSAVPFAFDLETDHLVRWHDPIEPVLAALVVTAAVGGAIVGSRLGAALSLGAVGLSVSALFASRGAPDLALTQLLVETVIVVGFVMGLGHLTRRFPPMGAMWRRVRITAAVLVGAAVSLALLASSGSSVSSPPIEELTAGAVDEGGGNNVVNVILTDIRALDTLGEVVVLMVAAIGVLALARVRPGEGTT